LGHSSGRALTVSVVMARVSVRAVRLLLTIAAAKESPPL